MTKNQGRCLSEFMTENQGKCLSEISEKSTSQQGDSEERNCLGPNNQERMAIMFIATQTYNVHVQLEVAMSSSTCTSDLLLWSLTVHSDQLISHSPVLMQLN